MLAIQGWLHDTNTLDFFTRIERSGKESGEELLVAELYLQQHGQTFDSARLASVIEQFPKTTESEEILLKYAGELRHQSFVPWLLQIVEEEPREKYGNAQWVLEGITFRLDVRGRTAWNDWAAKHANETRAIWKEQAVSELLALAKTNLPAAQKFMSEANYRWNDVMLLADMERLAEFKPLHSEIVGWINLTYHQQPFVRARFRALALKIQRESGDSLERWAKELMRSWDFLYEDKRPGKNSFAWTTWRPEAFAEYEGSNRRSNHGGGSRRLVRPSRPCTGR